MICCNYLRDPARVMNYRTGYLGRCEFTPSVLGVVAMADGVWGTAGTGAPGFAVTALAAGVAAAAGAGGAEAIGVAAGFTFAPSGTVFARLRTTLVPSPRPLMILTAEPSVPATSIGVSLM